MDTACFGVELTVDNIIAEYFYDKFNLKLRTARMTAASFGLANVVSRPGGEWFSDLMGKRYRMRGRLWTLWVVQNIGGVLFVLLGRVRTLGASVAVMVAFSLFCQAACGLTFGVVPFVSRRSLGMISGMTGAGRNVGAVLTQLLFFRGSRYTKETGITLTGVMIICCSLPICLIYFPQLGGMFFGPSRENATEEDYFPSEWNSKEKEKSLHHATLKCVENSRSERVKINTEIYLPETESKCRNPTILKTRQLNTDYSQRHLHDTLNLIAAELAMEVSNQLLCNPCIAWHEYNIRHVWPSPVPCLTHPRNDYMM